MSFGLTSMAEIRNYYKENKYNDACNLFLLISPIPVFSFPLAAQVNNNRLLYPVGDGHTR